MVHTIKYLGKEIEVVGIYEDPEYDTGYSGGWTTKKVFLKDRDITYWLNNSAIQYINYLVNLIY